MIGGIPFFRFSIDWCDSARFARFQTQPNPLSINDPTSMLVSLKWLAKYIDLPMSHEELAHRLSLSGLNHESTDEIEGDIVLDLEVTSKDTSICTSFN